MPFTDWQKLVYGIERGECILFLGPELPLVAPDGAREAALDLLARRIWERVDPQDRPSDDTAGGLSHTTEAFLEQEDELGLEMEVNTWQEELRKRRSTVHEDLAALPFLRIITTGFDPLMEAALERAGKPPRVARYHFRETNEQLLPEPEIDSPILFYLNGTPREPSSLVLTETHLLDFLAALISKNPPLPFDLNDALTHSRLFLFLGFGLRHWHLRILLHVLKVLRGNSRSFAIERLDREAEDSLEDAILFYDQFKFDIHHQGLAEFVRELRERVGPAIAETAIGKESRAPTRAAEDVPTVFICHAKEDAVQARAVHDALEEFEIQPWFDEESLRGGDRWDELIEETIKKVAYFVVLYSRHLHAKIRRTHYVGREINVALDVFHEYRVEGPFIIPARLDDTPLASKLQEFHWVDLRKDRGIQDLIRAIKRQVGEIA